MKVDLPHCTRPSSIKIQERCFGENGYPLPASVTFLRIPATSSGIPAGLTLVTRNLKEEKEIFSLTSRVSVWQRSPYL